MQNNLVFLVVDTAEHQVADTVTSDRTMFNCGEMCCSLIRYLSTQARAMLWRRRQRRH
jgi:hypothetical protein